MAEREYKTNSRTKILEYLTENESRSVSVAQIREHLEEADTAVNKTTIYRYLEKLEKEGRVVRITAADGKTSSYQIAEENGHCDEHLHLKCIECGSVQHLDCGFMDEITEHIQKDHGFQIQCRNSTIYGVCQRCQNRNRSRHQLSHR